jgi:glycosyltransferase involved in cell wall biosynthesis
MIEAMACGTPVLAYRAGAVAEVIEHGVTGLIVNGIDQARIALVQAISLDRRKIRRRFEERFGADRMANDYVRVYRNLVRHAARLARDAAHGSDKGARIGGTELIADLCKRAD